MVASSPMRTLVLALVTLFVVLGLGCGQPLQPTLEVAPESATLITGRETQLTVTRRFPGGQIDDVTTRVTYSSSNRNVLNVTESGRLVPGTEAGSAVVRVDDPNSDAFAVAAFNVVPPRIETIDVIPSPALVLAPREGRQFEARARFSDGVTRDVTRQVQWSSSNEAAARVGRTPADSGYVTAVAEGDAIVAARDAETGVEGRTTVFVRGQGPQLVAIVVTPNPAAVPIGGTTQFVALGVFSDGSTNAITPTVQWTSSDETVLTIDGNGVASGVAAGHVTVTAKRIDSGIVASAGATVQ